LVGQAGAEGGARKNTFPGEKKRGRSLVREFVFASRREKQNQVFAKREKKRERCEHGVETGNEREQG